MFRLIREWWYARQRAFDLKILWPQCCAQAPDIVWAKMAFAAHAFEDPAWRALGPHLETFIDDLEAPQ